MIKDKILRFFFIPFLGIIIPFLSDIVTYSFYSLLELIAIYIYFIFMSWSIWACSTWLHHKIRDWFPPDQNIFIKIATVCFTNALFGGAIAGILALVWYRISKDIFQWLPYLLTVILSVLAVIVFTLVYEILYLSKEREIDSKVVEQLDWERSVAEMENLKNELEPHFIFNSLNTLSHLILNAPETAHEFNSKLASVFKYFLINKERDLISLHNEMEFIENYFFLVKLRYDNQIYLSSCLGGERDGKIMIVPFALQITLENAIKHNEFTSKCPLNISIELRDDFLLIKNNKKQKKYIENSTGIGLKNLKSRYQAFCKKSITIEDMENEYIVKLPIIYQNL